MINKPTTSLHEAMGEGGVVIGVCPDNHVVIAVKEFDGVTQEHHMLISEARDLIKELEKAIAFAERNTSEDTLQ